MKIFKAIWRWFFSRGIKPRKLEIFKGDTPPENFSKHSIVLARENGEDWSVAFLCPCGCGDRLELNLIPEINPSWKITVNAQGYPTLYPSVWRKKACRSHFWMRNGIVTWCD